MITGKLTFGDLLQGGRKFYLMKRGKTLFSCNLEVTRRCNLRCDFCDYWREKGEEQPLEDYGALIRHLNPLHITITGGEPLLRQDLEHVVQGIRAQAGFVYMNMITNGRALDEERARSLWHAGLSQISVSLDFPDERHDQNRRAPGLWSHLSRLLPALARTEIDNLCLNSIIMKDNLGDLLEIARVASDWGIKVSYSTYNPFKNGNTSHVIPKEWIKKLEGVIEDLLAWKQRHRNITNSRFYLENVPRYLREGGISGCLAGCKWVQIAPNGAIRRCSDKEFLGDGLSFRPDRVAPTRCKECWYACRGEAEAPLDLKRIVELNR